MTQTSEKQKRLRAREFYKELGSIKRVAKKMGETRRTVRAWVKDLTQNNPQNSRDNFQSKRLK